jgi:ERF superfamily
LLYRPQIPTKLITQLIKNQTPQTKMIHENAHSAFISAQKEFSPAVKSVSNPFFKSKYADLSVCIEAVMDALNNHGLGLLQVTHDRGASSSGVCVETVLIHESGTQISGGLFHMPAIKEDPQAYGSALTYARRYSLMATCGIAPEDDDGNSASGKAIPAAKARDLFSKCSDMKELQALWRGLSSSEKAEYTSQKDAAKTRLTQTLETGEERVKPLSANQGDEQPTNII